MLSTLGLVRSCVFSPYNMLAVLSISIRILIMQEFSPCICMLVRIKMAQPESFTTLFLQGQSGRYHETLFMLPSSNTLSLICILETILKMADCIFCAKGNACVTREQLPPHRLTLQNTYFSLHFQGLISERFVGLEGRNQFPPVTYFQLHRAILTFREFFTSNQSLFTRLGDIRSNLMVIS